MSIFTFKLAGLKKDQNKPTLDCSDEFDNFSGGKKTVLKIGKKNERNTKKFSLKIGLPGIMKRKTKNLPEKEEERLCKKVKSVTENVYVSLHQLDNVHRMEIQINNTYESINDKIECRKHSLSPDYEVYDGDFQFMYYNNAFFC